MGMLQPQGRLVAFNIMDHATCDKIPTSAWAKEDKIER